MSSGTLRSVIEYMGYVYPFYIELGLSELQIMAFETSATKDVFTEPN